MVPAGARCGTHTEIFAVDLCQRCGRFLCGDCVVIVRDDAFCAECSTKVHRPASVLARASVFVAAAAYVVTGALVTQLKQPLFAVLMVFVPAPLALASLVMATLEWRRIRAGLSPALGKRWVVVTFAIATPLFVLLVLAIAWGVSIALRVAGSQE